MNKQSTKAPYINKKENAEKKQSSKAPYIIVLVHVY